MTHWGEVAQHPDSFCDVAALKWCGGGDGVRNRGGGDRVSLTGGGGGIGWPIWAGRGRVLVVYVGRVWGSYGEGVVAGVWWVLWLMGGKVSVRCSGVQQGVARQGVAFVGV